MPHRLQMVADGQIGVMSYKLLINQTGACSARENRTWEGAGRGGRGGGEGGGEAG